MLSLAIITDIGIHSAIEPGWFGAESASRALGAARLAAGQAVRGWGLLQWQDAGKQRASGH